MESKEQKSPKKEEKAKSGEKEQTEKDPKNMKVLIESKSSLGNSIEIKIEGQKAKKYIIINPDLKSLRILNTSTVKYFLQTYLFNLKTNSFEISDRNYKNVIKTKINDMSADKKYVRSCLLQMLEGEQTVFELDKSILKDIFDKAKKAFLERKKKDKEKELKQEEKQKLIEKQKEKEKTEGKKPEKFPEIVIDQSLVEKVVENYEFEEKLYYRIFIEDVLPEKPIFPGDVKDLEKFVKSYNKEISVLLIKRDYNTAESWCNELISKIFTMRKGDIKKKYESENFKENKIRIENEMKKPLLNLTYIYEEKSRNPQGSSFINQAIDLIEKTYYKKYPEQYDESYIKITGRYVRFCCKIKSFDKAEKLIENIENNCSRELLEKTNVIKSLKEEVSNSKKEFNSSNNIKAKGALLAGGDKGEEYDWNSGVNEEELTKNLGSDASSVGITLDLANKDLNK